MFRQAISTTTTKYGNSTYLSFFSQDLIRTQDQIQILSFEAHYFTRSFVETQQQPPKQRPQRLANEIHEGAYNQYQMPCDIAAYYIHRSLSVEGVEYLGHITKPREVWDVLKLN